MALTDMFQPRLCELGKIKIGRKEDKVRTGKGGAQWRAPEKIDHFIVTTLQRNQSDDLVVDTPLMQELQAEHSDPDGKVRCLPIYLLSNEIEDVLQSSWLWYIGRSKLGAKSDGVELTKFFNTKTGQKLDPPEVVEWKDEYKDLRVEGAPMFKKHTTFNCVIGSKTGRWGGVYRLRTTSVISGEQLYGSLLHLKQLTAGVLRGLPLWLVLRPVIVRPEGRATTVYVVHVELRGADLHELQTKALEQKRYELAHLSEVVRSEREYRRMLVAPGDEVEAADVVDVTDEFHPDLSPAEGAVVEGPVERDPLFEDEPEVSVVVKDDGTVEEESQ